MANDKVSFMLAAWGAVLSTLLAIPKVIEFFYTIRRNLSIIAFSEPPFNALTVVVTNIGRRPVTITSLEVVYGPEATLAEQRVLSRSDHLPKKLEESDLWSISIPREELISEARKNGVRQAYNHRLWVTVLAGAGKSFSRVVQIDSSIIEVPYMKEAEHYIVADLLLGFPKMHSEMKMFSLRR